MWQPNQLETEMNGNIKRVGEPDPRQETEYWVSLKRLLALVVFTITAGVQGAPQPLQADFEPPTQPSETLPGFRSNAAYAVSGIDRVDIFSGGLGITIPLSPEYPLSAGTSWSLSAHYSSKLWHMSQCVGQAYPELLTLSYSLLAGSPILGAGWTLDVGQIRKPYATAKPSYHGPDGSVREFDFPAGDSGPYYSKDGSRIRISAIGTSVYAIEFADGSRHTFGHRFRAGGSTDRMSFPDFADQTPEDPLAIRWGLTSIVDRFGTVVLRVEYVLSLIHISEPTRPY